MKCSQLSGTTWRRGWRDCQTEAAVSGSKRVLSFSIQHYHQEGEAGSVDVSRRTHIGRGRGKAPPVVMFSGRTRSSAMCGT